MEVRFVTEASPIESTDHRVSSIFTHNGDHNENSITKMNGDATRRLGKGGSVESSQYSSNTSQERDSVDAVFEEPSVRQLSLERRSSSHDSSFEEERAGQGTVKKIPSLSHSGLSSSTTLNSSKSAGDLTTVLKRESTEERNLVCKSNLW